MGAGLHTTGTGHPIMKSTAARRPFAVPLAGLPSGTLRPSHSPVSKELIPGTVMAFKILIPNLEDLWGLVP